MGELLVKKTALVTASQNNKDLKTESGWPRTDATRVVWFELLFDNVV